MTSCQPQEKVYGQQPTKSAQQSVLGVFQMQKFLLNSCAKAVKEITGS